MQQCLKLLACSELKWTHTLEHCSTLAFPSLKPCVTFYNLSGNVHCPWKSAHAPTNLFDKSHLEICSGQMGMLSFITRTDKEIETRIGYSTTGRGKMMPQLSYWTFWAGRIGLTPLQDRDTQCIAE